MPVKIRGNDYITVAERVTAAHEAGGFTMVDSFPMLEGEHPYWRTIILVGDRQFIGTAQIKFNARAGTADGDSPLECAETSALGRALGFAGFGVVEGIASADELARVSTDDPLLPREDTQAPKHLRPVPKPTPEHAVSWSNVRLRGRKLGYVYEDAWRQAVEGWTGKKGMKGLTADDLATVHTRIREMELRIEADDAAAEAAHLEETTWKGGA